MTQSSAPLVAVEPEELAPVREALLDLARQEARRVLTAADAEAASALSRADLEAEQIRSDARVEAQAAAAALLATERARIDRESRGVILRARRAGYDQLVRRAREAVRALCDEPGVLDGLAALARSRLGADATVLPGPDGGVVAESGARRVSYPLAALTEQAVAELLTSRQGT